ncbi:tRNA (guanosine(46)-N7)-methyltransferase TrmB [Pikeienuella piscinae]|uniref:tRNA (guanine-N(7)-)-methyltransferase n=1 Tax=Pikeienuella piscinae TaxID=2748098 RepID=A0A7M3T5F9_9RHOB|nr:tRNA (guanine(46)-N(7))-methyltransferase TrmB [Pikeienuella piscinae]QIE57240.1 tRNA (guanosine(46)-N7)-methyltransferase TrmB [Pikeienuella piscinae]
MGKLTPREDGAPWRNFYGRRHGKTLRKHQQALLDERLPELAPPGVAWAENPERHPVDFRALAPGARETWLEIGFGGGEHLVAMAAANPDVLLIGCEPFVNGVAMCLSAIERAGPTNIRLHAGDAREIFDVAHDGAFTRIFVNYPDPWPKTRHHNRRFIGPDNLPHLARIAAPGARLHIASDIPDYIRHSLEAVRPFPQFRWTAERPEDWRRPWPDWPGTRYEAKALREGRTPCYLTFVRC